MENQNQQPTNNQNNQNNEQPVRGCFDVPLEPELVNNTSNLLEHLTEEQKEKLKNDIIEGFKKSFVI